MVMWPVLMSWVMKLLAGWDAVMWLVVRWRGVSYCGWLQRGMWCHVIWVVTSFDAMWLLVLRHVTWCIEELLTIVPRYRIECYELKMSLVLRSRRVVQGVTMWWWKSTTTYYTVLLQYYSVLHSTTPVLLCTTRYYSVLQSTTPVQQRTKYSSTTLYYTVLLCTTMYYPVPVLQRTTPVLLCTTKYYNLLLQYYSVLQSISPLLQRTTPVLLCTTKYYASTTTYYSSTTLYYKVLRQQSTTPVLLCTTKYYSSTTLYYKVLRQYYSVLRGATRVTVQLHQILRLPGKMNVRNDLRHIWKLISNAWSQ